MARFNFGSLPRACLFFCLAGAILLSACPGNDSTGLKDEEFTIQVGGDNGQPFNGSYVVLKMDGSIASEKIDGVAPRTFKVTGLQIDLTISKSTAAGLLDVQLKKGKDIVSEGTISHSFGSLNLIGH